MINVDHSSASRSIPSLRKDTQMPDLATTMLTTAVAISVLMALVWALSLVLRDASIVDIAWGLGFVIVAWGAYLTLPDSSSAFEGNALRLLIVVLVTIWGIRLAGYLAWRNLRHGLGHEDPRYQAMRANQPYFPLLSLLTVFGLQGVIMWIVSLPVQVAIGTAHEATLGPLALIGVALWLTGLSFEAIGDWQLARFKADPANSGRVMDRGLWRYTRHPNYFGDFCVWWGLYLIALQTGLAATWWTAIGPLLMSVLLLRVSGVTLLERRLVETRPAYAEYAARTSAFFPRPPSANEHREGR